MKWIYVSSLYISAVFMMVCLLYSIRKPRHMSIERLIRWVLLFAGISQFFYGTALVTFSSQIAVVFYGLYHIAVDAMLFSMMKFVKKYTKIRQYHKPFRIALWIAAGVDSILMLINCVKPVLFLCEFQYDRIGNYYRIGEKAWLYTYHVVFVYLMMLLMVKELIQKLIQSPKIYKIKYAGVLIQGIIIFTLHTLWLCLDWNIDYSIIWYAVIITTIFYFSLFYISKGLAEKLLHFMMFNMQDGIICLDIEDRCVYTNELAKLYCDEEIDQQIETWLSEDVPVDAENYEWNTTCRVNGEICQCRLQYQKIFDRKAKYLGRFFVLHDCTAEQEALATEKYRATHDALTGIYNKEYFFEVARDKILQNPSVDFCIISTDLKNFKLVNDIFGVEAGDKLLIQIAGVIRSLAGQDWIYGRMTGDKFAICLPQHEFHEEQFLNETVRMTRLTEKVSFKIHMHIGVYMIQDRNLKISMMCDRANLAIKAIKDSYQDVIAYYQENLRQDFINEQRVINEFEKAILSRQFQAYIQPQVSVEGTIQGGEVLVRWIHPENGMIPPYKFIGIFEQTGLISQLDKYMWELACMQLQKWKAAGLSEQYLSVNISPKDFYLLDVYKTMTSLVEYYDIEPKNLHLEITETAIMKSPETQLPLIEKLRDYGFTVEIDDFGSGYSSLNTLKDFQVDVLKIDMGFLRKTKYEDRSMIILKSIILMAKSLDMEIITEGVETKEQVEFLKKYGCDIFQGYYFAKPMTFSEFEKNYLNQIVSVP